MQITFRTSTYTDKSKTMYKSSKIESMFIKSDIILIIATGRLYFIG